MADGGNGRVGVFDVAQSTVVFPIVDAGGEGGGEDTFDVEIGRLEDSEELEGDEMFGGDLSLWNFEAFDGEREEEGESLEGKDRGSEAVEIEG